MELFFKLAKRISIFRINMMMKNMKNVLFSKKLRMLVKKVYGVEAGLCSYGYLGWPEGTKIGRYCSLASGTRYLRDNHPMSHASTSAVFYNPSLGYVDKKYDIDRTNLTIGNDVWIGQNVLITSRCQKIGDGAVVGAGSVVTKDVPPYAIVAGNPARLIRMRFDEETIELIEKSKWWDLEVNEILGFMDMMDSPKDFASAVIEYKRKTNERN